jgi:hypothetical protein
MLTEQWMYYSLIVGLAVIQHAQWWWRALKLMPAPGPRRLTVTLAPKSASSRAFSLSPSNSAVTLAHLVGFFLSTFRYTGLSSSHRASFAIHQQYKPDTRSFTSTAVPVCKAEPLVPQSYTQDSFQVLTPSYAQAQPILQYGYVLGCEDSAYERVQSATEREMG